MFVYVKPIPVFFYGMVFYEAINAFHPMVMLYCLIYVLQFSFTVVYKMLVFCFKCDAYIMHWNICKVF